MPKPSPSGSHALRSHRALIALNVALLGVLGVVTLGPGAAAQNQQRRLMGEYTMVGGAAEGVTGNVVYILDSSNMQLVALRWDQTRKAVSGIGYRDLRDDRAAGAGQR